jgi:hypothetical protein
MMFNDTTASAGGEVTATIEKPPSRQEKVNAWREQNRAAYNSACEHERCTCTPTRAEALIKAQWNNPPID